MNFETKRLICSITTSCIIAYPAKAGHLLASLTRFRLASVAYQTACAAVPF